MATAKQLENLKKARAARAVKRAAPTAGHAAALVESIKNIDYSGLSYDEVCALLTAFREGFDRAGEARRQKQEQLQAESLRAPCQTCGRQVDISRSGKYQVRTVRDEFFQPKNVFYCSQECVLAENLKGRKRTTPGER